VQSYCAVRSLPRPYGSAMSDWFFTYFLANVHPEGRFAGYH
jgi:hypothetical protein